MNKKTTPLAVAVGLAIIITISYSAGYLMKSKEDGLAQASASLIRNTNKSGFVSGELLIKFKAGVSEKESGDFLVKRGFGLKSEIKQLKLKVISVPEEAEEQLAAALSKNPIIDYAEVNSIASVISTTNDPYIVNGSEWHIAKIQANRAWEMTTGSTSTLIAVLDTGIAASHPDLVGKVINGYDYVNNDSNPIDDHGHGTQVAGTIAAWGNNGIGVAGVSYQSSIISIKVADSSGYSSYSNIAAGIIEAVNKGAKIINISIAGTESSTALQNAVDEAWGHNVVIIAGAGNAGTEVPMYPAALRNVFAVSATDSSDIKTSWSSYGSYVDISAPGSGIWTTKMDGTYGAVSGTSFSSPVVAGVAALLVSQNPQITNTEIVDRLAKTADDLGVVGYDIKYGYGRVNAYRALTGAGPSLPPSDTQAPITSVTFPTNASIIKGTINVTANATDNVGVTRVDLYKDGVMYASDVSAPYSYYLDTTSISNGNHTFQTKAYDASGNVGSSAMISVTVSNIQDTQAPIIKSLNAVLKGKSFVVNTEVTDNVGVSQIDIFLDEKLRTSCLGVNTCSVNISTNKLVAGPHFVKVLAYDIVKNVGTATTTVNK
jgi:thermitase